VEELDLGELLVFDIARYGRNDSRVAAICDVPYSWNCDIDVQFLLNRACAGRRTCSVEVDVATFTDPCGYSEFLILSYRCVPGRCRQVSPYEVYSALLRRTLYCGD